MSTGPAHVDDPADDVLAGFTRIRETAEAFKSAPSALGPLPSWLRLKLPANH
jgi:hypothetical protein